MSTINSKCCRLCLSDNEDNLHLLSEYCQQHDTCAKIRKYFSIPVDADVDVPNHICQRCLQQIISFSELIVIANKTQEYLLKLHSITCTNENADSFCVANDVTNETAFYQTNSSTSDENDKKDIVAHNLEPLNPVIMVDGRCVLRGKNLTKQLENFYDLVCDKCDNTVPVQFESFETLLRHFRNVHSIKGYVKCCQNKMTRRDYMIYHMCKHVQPDAFKCETCGKHLANPEMLRSHMFSHRPVEDWPHVCTECGRRFIFRRDMMDHKISHLPIDQRPSHICHQCGRKFITSVRLSIHKNTRHQKTPDMHMCHICARQFRTKSSLRQHHLHHHVADDEVRVQCDQCGKWLKKMCLSKHVENMHGTRSYPCKQCSHVSPSHSALRMHNKNRHTILTKEFTCQFCSRQFKMKKTLQEHLSQHTGERKFECQFCPRTFASSGNYYTHRKQMHSQELTYENNTKN